MQESPSEAVERSGWQRLVSASFFAGDFRMQDIMPAFLGGAFFGEWRRDRNPPYFPPSETKNKSVLETSNSQTKNRRVPRIRETWVRNPCGSCCLRAGREGWEDTRGTPGGRGRSPQCRSASGLRGGHREANPARGGGKNRLRHEKKGRNRFDRGKLEERGKSERTPILE